MCWEAIRAQGGVVEAGVNGVFEASEEFGVRWVAQCGGQLLDGKEGPYQDRPPLCPFRLSPLLTCSGSTIAFLKILKIQGPNPKI